MFKLLRRLLGMCEHQYKVVGIENVPWTPTTENSFLAVDMAHAGYIHHRSYTMLCPKCANVKVKRVKP